MYIRINQPINEIQREEILKALECLNVKFDVFNNAEKIVMQEEAEYRIELFQDENVTTLNEDVRNELIERLTDALYNDDYVINGEVICDITSDVLMEYENEPNNSLL